MSRDVFTEAVVRRCSVKKVFSKFSHIHRKTPVLESLFNKFAGLQETFKNSSFYRTPLVAASIFRNLLKICDGAFYINPGVFLEKVF